MVKNNDHLILHTEQSTAISSFLFSILDLNNIDLIEQINDSMSGNAFSFKQGKNVAISDGKIQPADGSFNYEDVYMEIELENYEVDLYKKHGDNFDIINSDIIAKNNNTQIISENNSYRPTAYYNKKYIYQTNNEQVVLFEKEYSELMEFSNLYDVEIDFAFNLDITKPQLIALTEDSIFGDKSLGTMKIYDMFEEAEPIEIEIKSGAYNLRSMLKFFTDENGVIVD